MTTALRERLQQTLGADYVLDRELGGAGMSRVFVAEDVRLGRRIVVKVLPPDLVAAISAARFEREILLAARLQHPHVLPVHASGEVDGRPGEGERRVGIGGEALVGGDVELELGEDLVPGHAAAVAPVPAPPAASCQASRRMSKAPLPSTCA